MTNDNRNQIVMLSSERQPRSRRCRLLMLLGSCVWTTTTTTRSSLFSEAAPSTPGFVVGLASRTGRHDCGVPPDLRCGFLGNARLSSTNGLGASTLSSAAAAVGDRIPIDESHPGLRRVHANPDVFVIENFLDGASCDDLRRRAEEKGTSLSPVAYAGWTEDVKELLGFAASGPVSWLAILGAWYEAQNDASASVPGLVLHALRNYAGLFALAGIGVAAYARWRADGLQALRTSSSTTLDDVSMPGVEAFVRISADLFRPASASASSSGMHEASYFEAPTVIRYDRDQSLAPHYDANRSADTEDANRGGQTLATLLVYLNDVPRGGITRFGKLPAAAADGPRVTNGEEERNLSVQPSKGDALLFFPADADGRFDERTEHEGMPAVDEKWIARIWRHAERVPPPFGLSDESIVEFSSK